MYQELFRWRVRGSQLFFSISRDPNEVKPYSVQYGGGGHYFDSLPQAIQYAASRKWITRAQAGSIIEKLSGE